MNLCVDLYICGMNVGCSHLEANGNLVYLLQTEVTVIQVNIIIQNKV